MKLDRLNVIQRIVLKRIVLRIAESIEEKHKKPPDMMTLFKIVEAFMGDNPHAYWEAVDWVSCWKPGINIFEYSKRLKKRYPRYTWRYAEPTLLDEFEIYSEDLELSKNVCREESKESLEQVINKWFNSKMDKLNGWRRILLETLRTYMILSAKTTSTIYSILEKKSKV